MKALSMKQPDFYTKIYIYIIYTKAAEKKWPIFVNFNPY